MTQMEQFDLFSFDFTEENEALRKDKMSEEKVAAQFSKLQKMFKERGNGYYLNRDYLPKDMLDYLEQFERLGLIEKRESTL